MEITFATNQLRRNFEESDRAVRKWGPVVGRRFVMRIEQIYAVQSFEDLYGLQALRLHPLKGTRSGEYAVDLDATWRLIVVPTVDKKGLLVKEVSNHYD